MQDTQDELLEAPATKADPSDPYYKTRRCKFIVMQETCPYAENCEYAHSPEELRPLNGNWSYAVAPHWQGDAVQIGIVEHAMFWDLPQVGLLDVVCNRNTCLGNPFATRLYSEGEERAERDGHGWAIQMHEDLCVAFEEYLGVLLDPSSEEDLRVSASRIARKHSATLSDTWVAQRLRRSSVSWSLDSLARKVKGGQRLRLLCHCRPHVRCHTEFLKAHLEKFAPARGNTSAPDMQSVGRVDHLGALWPGFGLNSQICQCKSQGWRCSRESRALDAGTMKMYCAQCWSKHSRDMSEYGSQFRDLSWRLASEDWAEAISSMQD